MFGSATPFGQPSGSSFGSQSMFGQTNSASSNPFALKPFGSPNTFGAQTGASMFGGASTGVFGQPSASTFGASSAPSFGSPAPAFGASTSPAFCSSSSSLGGSLFGSKPAFGGSGSLPSQSSPFSSSFQQTQPMFGSNAFGSAVPFGASSQPAFGATNTQTIGTTSNPAFGATSSPAFGATSAPAFSAATTSAFGSATTSLFGSTGTTFGVSTSPAFRSTGATAFGASYGPSSATAFGASAMGFGSSSVPAFGASGSLFNFGSAPTFGQSISAFGSTHGTTPSPFGGQSSQQGVQAGTPFGSTGFGQATFGGQVGGTRIAPFNPTLEAGSGGGTHPAGKLESVSAMPVYKDKNHEELRWEDYQRGDKGGANPSGQAAGGTGFIALTQPSLFGATGASGQTAENHFSSSTSSKPFAVQAPIFGSTSFASTSTSLFSSPFNSSSSTSNTSLSGAPVDAYFGSNSSSVFGGTTPPAFISSPSTFGSSVGGSSSSFGGSLTSGNNQSSAVLLSSTPLFGQTSSPFGQPSITSQQSTPASGSSLFSTPLTGFGVSIFSYSTTPPTFCSNSAAGFGQTALSPSTPFRATGPSQTSSVFSCQNFGQTQPALSGGLGVVSNIFNQGTIGQHAASQGNIVMQPAPAPNMNPFGTLPATPQMSIGHVGSASSVHYGISSMPVAEKSFPVRTFSMLVPRHLSQRRIGLPPRRYHPKTAGRKVPFFTNDEVSSPPRADAFVIPRENPRALIIRPAERCLTLSSQEGKTLGKPSTLVVIESFAEEDDDSHFSPEQNNAPTPLLKQSPSPKANDRHDNQAQKRSQDATIYKHVADIDALMPKLQHCDYYTEPQLQELAAEECLKPGSCRHVKDFVVGRHGYGSIKFCNETDVRELDLDSIVQFNNREVIVYQDESRKPPVGQGLNKPAEITLLNIMCMNKKMGKQYTEGPKVDKYKEMLMKKAEEQGAEFVSYDAAKGEWKFRVKHFSIYRLEEDDSDVSKS